jgi:hypothetical protein
VLNIKLSEFCLIYLPFSIYIDQFRPPIDMCCTRAVKQTCVQGSVTAFVQASLRVRLRASFVNPCTQVIVCEGVRACKIVSKRAFTQTRLHACKLACTLHRWWHARLDALMLTHLVARKLTRTQTCSHARTHTQTKLDRTNACRHAYSHPCLHPRLQAYWNARWMNIHLHTWWQARTFARTHAHTKKSLHARTLACKHG